MPKKIPILKKRVWLQTYEEGKSEASIAHGDHCDIRTVKKGIEEARRERDTHLARADLIKESLRGHNQHLLSLIRELMPALIPLPSNQAIPWSENPTADSIAVAGGLVRYETWPKPKVLSITLDVETKVEWEYVQEHLKRDRFGVMLGQWEKALFSHFEARMAMKRKLTELLKEKTGYQLASRPVDAPCLYTSSADILLKPTIEWLLEPEATRDPAENIDIDLDSDEIRYAYGTAVAYAPGATQKCRDNIISALNELKTSQEAENIIDTYRSNADSATKARRSAEEIDMMGLVPGQCRICQRLGM
jgi:hypothetical protein